MAIGALAGTLAGCPDLSGFSGGADDAGASDAPADAPASLDGSADAAADADADAAPADTLALEAATEDPNDIVDLSARGTLDWVEIHVPTQPDRCATCMQLLLGPTSGATLQPYIGDTRTWIWTNGTPKAMGTLHGGVYVENVGSSILVTAPTAPTKRLLTAWIDTYNVGAKLQASIDGTALTPQTVTLAELPNAVRYTVKVHFAAAAGHTLALSFLETSAIALDGDKGNAAFSAMTLAAEP